MFFCIFILPSSNYILNLSLVLISFFVLDFVQFNQTTKKPEYRPKKILLNKAAKNDEQSNKNLLHNGCIFYLLTQFLFSGVGFYTSINSPVISVTFPFFPSIHSSKCQVNLSVAQTLFFFPSVFSAIYHRCCRRRHTDEVAGCVRQLISSYKLLLPNLNSSHFMVFRPLS